MLSRVLLPVIPGLGQPPSAHRGYAQFIPPTQGPASCPPPHTPGQDAPSHTSALGFFCCRTTISFLPIMEIPKEPIKGLRLGEKDGDEQDFAVSKLPG